ncbi:MAG: WecB/TagA/CpsF family glycosyltransferase [Spirochaetales bacterium]
MDVAPRSTEPLRGRKERVLGIPLDDIPPEELEETLSSLLGTEGVRPVVFLGLWDLLRARRDSEFRSWVERASLVIPTTKGVVKGARFLRKKVSHRYHPFDVMIRLFRLMEERGLSLYVLGGRLPYLQQAEKNLKQTFPGLRLVGRYPGYYPSQVEKDVLLAMRKASPHCLLLGPGLRGRERWAQRKLQDLPRSIVVHDPESFDIISGKRTRPSKETVEKGHEYLGGLVRHPWRVFRGIFYLYYLLLLLIYRLRKL